MSEITPEEGSPQLPVTKKEISEEAYGDGDYEDLSYEDDGASDGASNQATWGFTQKEIVLPSELNGLRKEIEEKAKTLNLTFYHTDSTSKTILLMGEGFALEEMATFIRSLTGLMERSTIPKVTLGEYVQKEIPLTGSFRHFKPLIEKLSETLELVIEYDQTKLTVHGYDRRIKDLMAFLFEKEIEYGQGQFVDRDINISTFHRVFRNEIEIKAVSLGIKFDFSYDELSVRGPRKLVDQLILYLMALETRGKKALFPVYWDFSDNNPLSLVDIPKNSDEYKLVQVPFHKTMGSTTILSIRRIQNKYLMDQYIMVINKKIEERPGEPINRKLLFHGTRQNPPDKIYANFDTGFDLQYAQYGACGKGLYFAENANYSHGYAYPTPQGTRQMFLADVYVGKAYAGGGHTTVKAPKGYDSVNNVGAHHYIVYHNFYSYPLYLIDYK